MQCLLKVKGREMNGTGYLIAIGLDRTDNEKPLRYAAKDAISIRDLLSESGYATELITDSFAKIVSREDINSAFDKMNKSMSSEIPFIFYFAGHCDEVNERDSKICRLHLSNFSPADNNTYLDKQIMQNFINSVQSNKALFIIDSCRSGELATDTTERFFNSESLGNRSSTKPTTLAKHIDSTGKTIDANDLDRSSEDNCMAFDPEWAGRVIVASCLPGELSYEVRALESGLFTSCLLEALKGEGQDKESHDVKAFDLLKYLIRRVPDAAKSHQLFKKNEDGTGNKAAQNCCIKMSGFREDFSICRKDKDLVRTHGIPERFFRTLWDTRDEDKGIIETLKDVHNEQTPELPSCLAYKGKAAVAKFVEFAEKSSSHSLELVTRNVDDFLDHVLSKASKPICLVSLGIGDGKKDAVIINKLLGKQDNPVKYYMIDKSDEMVKIGIKNLKNSIPQSEQLRLTIMPFDADFSKLVEARDGIPNEFQKILGNEYTKLFLLLGNTLGNFQEEVLLGEITQVMHRDDWLLIDNQLTWSGATHPTARKREIDELRKIYDSVECMEFIKAIMAEARITDQDGTFSMGEPVWDRQGVLTVKEQFIVGSKPLSVPGRMPIRANTRITVLYSKKYTRDYIEQLLSKKNLSLSIEKQYYDNDQRPTYALILTRRK
jgi:hypothetical protein